MPNVDILYIQDKESSELVLAYIYSKAILGSYEVFYQDMQGYFF